MTKAQNTIHEINRDCSMEIAHERFLFTSADASKKKKERASAATRELFDAL